MSTLFVDGPAMGVRLELERAPIFLRVVVDRAGKWDALDQLDDQSRVGETIYVYRLDGPASYGIACSRSPRRCRRFCQAEYRLYDAQPSDAEARNQWPQWTQAQWERIKPKG